MEKVCKEVVIKPQKGVPLYLLFTRIIKQQKKLDCTSVLPQCYLSQNSGGERDFPRNNLMSRCCLRRVMDVTGVGENETAAHHHPPPPLSGVRHEIRFSRPYRNHPRHPIRPRSVCVFASFDDLMKCESSPLRFFVVGDGPGTGDCEIEILQGNLKNVTLSRTYIQFW